MVEVEAGRPLQASVSREAPEQKAAPGPRWDKGRRRQNGHVH